MNEGMARGAVVPFKCEEWVGEFAATAGGRCRFYSLGLCGRRGQVNM